MKARTRVWLVIAALLVLLGGILFTGVMTTLNWDFTKLATVKYETNTYEINESFSNLSLKTDTADILFAVSDNGKCKVECYEAEKAKHIVAVEEDTLAIKVADNRAWYDHVGIGFATPRVTVYLPKAEYNKLCIDEETGNVEIPKDFIFKDVDISLSTGDVDFCAVVSGLIKIKTSTGKIRVENTFAGALDLTASTGEIRVSDVICTGDANIEVSTGKTNVTNLTCNNLKSNANTGTISLINALAARAFFITTSTGDVKFDGSDATEIFVVTDTGKVRGSLLTDKIFVTETDTGKVVVPKTSTGGKCEIKTNTGDIDITIRQS